MRRFFLSAALLIAACRSTPGVVRAQLPDDAGYVTLPREVLLQQASQHDCGAEALDAVLAYHLRPGSLARLREELAVSSVDGAFPQQIMQAARDRGFTAQPVQGSFEAVRREIDAKRPTLLMLRVGGERNHFVVATGYHAQRREVVCAHYDTRVWVVPEHRLTTAWEPCGFLQISLAPDPGTALIDHARTLEADGRYAEALEVYRKVLAVLPDDARARTGAGNCLALTGEYPEARREYLVAYRAGSRDPELLNNLADVSLHLGRDVDRAARWADEAVAGYRAGVARETTELKRAVAVRKLALGLGTLGEVKLGQGDVAAARTHFEESLRLFGNRQPELRIRRLNQIAYCCEKLGESERAARLRAEAKRLKG